MPVLWDFPFRQWFRLMSRQSRPLGFESFGYGAPAGYLPLRRAIAQYLRQSRGVRCEPEQAVIVSGIQQALACQLLLGPGDGAWIEDPGYTQERAILRLSKRMKPVFWPFQLRGRGKRYISVCRI